MFNRLVRGKKYKDTWDLVSIPKEGDITRGVNIGKTKDTAHIFKICPSCNTGRWIQVRFSFNNPVCNKCSGKNMPHLYRENNYNWKGGKYKNYSGYVILVLHPSDPYYSMVTTHSKIFEHRYVMAKHLGRVLNTWEIVHHKNHIRDDNRIENLEVTTPRINTSESRLWNENIHLKEQILELGNKLKGNVNA